MRQHQAIEAFGVAMGPFRVGDLVGNDVSWAIRKRRRAERSDFKASTLPDRLCELGRLGQKTGAGWYDYPEGPRHPRPSPVVDQLISRQRSTLGIAPRAIDDAEIVDRLVYALVNEGARIPEEGIAARADRFARATEFSAAIQGQGRPQCPPAASACPATLRPQRSHQANQGKRRAGPEQEHPLEEVGAQPLQAGVQVGPESGQLLVELGNSRLAPAPR